MHGDHRRGVQPGQLEPEPTAKPGACPSQAGKRPSGSRCRHEPDRPPARRRRRPHLGRPSPGDPLGQAHQGRADPQQEKGVVSSSSSARATPRRRVANTCRVPFGKAPLSTAYVLKKAEAVPRKSGRNEVIKIWSRRSTILPQFVGLTFGVYNGQEAYPGATSPRT